MKQQTFEVEGEKKTGESLPRRNWVNQGRDLINSPNEKVKTLYDNFLYGVQQSGGNKPFLGKRSIVDGVAGPYTWMTYDEALKSAQAFGSFLVKNELAIKEHVGLFSINRPEWSLTELGCFMYNYSTVPLYDTLGIEAIEFILNQTECKLIVASAGNLKTVLALAAEKKLPMLKILVSMDENVDQKIIEQAKELELKLFTWSQVEAIGNETIAEHRKPTPESICTICYTSGTTGMPKGVILTHQNMIAAGQSYLFAGKMKAGIDISSSDIHISYLPLAHVLERALFSVLVGQGCRIGFYQGDTLKLLDDVAELKPTIFASVPRLYNRIYDKIWQNVKNTGGLGEKLFRMAYKSKQGNMPNTVNHMLWDALVFKKVRERLGGRIRCLISGGAPLSSTVTEFLRIAFSCDVLEGYGQTETCAAGTITQLGDYSVGHVGAPFPCCEVKLIDVPEMNYLTTDKPPRGEICFRGFNVFQGYFKDPVKTAETLKDGWNLTGDIGSFDDMGRLTIFDRKKNIFKLAQGEYIAAEKIENVYGNHELVAQAFVYGDSLQSTIVAIIIPDEPVLMKWAKEQGKYEGKSFADLCKDESVEAAVLAAITQYGKAQGLKGFENVKAIHLDSELFSAENNLLTPTFKLKRKDAKEKYQAQITKMYEKINASQ